MRVRPIRWLRLPGEHVDPPALAEGQVVLRDLVVLRQVRVVVVLAVELGERGDLAPAGETHPDRVLDGRRG